MNELNMYSDRYEQCSDCKKFKEDKYIYYLRRSSDKDNSHLPVCLDCMNLSIDNKWLEEFKRFDGESQ